MPKLPCVAIVGRPNVGKSSLLNALAGRLISIVQDMPGVTRDRISTPVAVGGRYIELVDTGGYGFQDPDQLTEHIKRQVELAMHRADVVLFIVDCQSGLTSADEEIAALLRRESIKTILVANKADGERADLVLGDFARLGLGTPIGVSAANGRRVEDIFTALKANLDLSKAPTQMASPDMHMAIVGKRNAGKSTLVNAIAKLYEGEEDRVIVSEVPGTTRDSVDVRFEKDGKTLVVIDTAGVRKKRHMVTNDIEFYSFHRAQRSVRRADVVLMLIDGTETISEPDRKLGQYIAEEFKPVILVVNKWDLTMKTIRENRKGEKQELRDEQIMEEYSDYLAKELPWLDYAPIAFTTAKEGKNIQRVLDLAAHLAKQSAERLGTGKLNAAVKQIVEEHSQPTASGNRLKVYYATQVDVAPPTIVLFVNQPAYVTDDYTRYIINRFRDLLPYSEVPLRLFFRGRGERGGSTVDEQSTVAPGSKPVKTPAGTKPANPKASQRPVSTGGRSKAVPGRARANRATPGSKGKTKGKGGRR